jgi:predicted nucleic acid-binding protein
MKRIDSNKNYLLDTSAVLTLWNEEEGFEIVEAILKRNKTNLTYISFMTFMEGKYRIWRNNGKNAAFEFIRDLNYLPIIRIDVDDILLETASEIKALNSLSVADSFIIASAIKTESILVHKDPEFEQVKNKVTMLKLPYKRV